MPTAETAYTAQFPYPDLLERGRDNLVNCPVYHAGALVVPTAAGSSCTVYNDSNQVVATPVVSEVGNVLQATVDTADLVGHSFAQNWRIEWSAVLAGEAETFQFRNEAALVRNQLYPVITDVDLLRIRPSLASMRPSTDPTLQSPIFEAWADIQNKLWEQGNRPNLIVSPASLRKAHKLLSFAYAYEGMSDGASPDDTYTEIAAGYRERFEKAWAAMTFRYDEDEDGIPDSNDTRKGTRGTVFLVDQLWNG